MIWFSRKKMVPLQILWFCPHMRRVLLKSWQGLQRRLLAIGLHELFSDSYVDDEVVECNDLDD